MGLEIDVWVYELLRCIEYIMEYMVWRPIAIIRKARTVDGLTC